MGTARICSTIIKYTRAYAIMTDHSTNFRARVIRGTSKGLFLPVLTVPALCRRAANITHRAQRPNEIGKLEPCGVWNIGRVGRGNFGGEIQYKRF